MPEAKRRPVSTKSDTRESPAPEKVIEAARTRETEDDERDGPGVKVRPIRGGEIHWFTGSGIARETR